MSSRTLRVQTPHMTGADVGAWQSTLNRQMETWGVGYRVAVDEDYGVATRDLTATVLYGLGYGQSLMANGVTPALRIKVRNKRQNPAEKARYATRAGWRKRLKARHSNSDVASPLSKILSSAWGYHPPVHDGVDLICNPNAPLLAICRAKVIRADGSGWWGKGAPSPAIAARGDGIIVLESLTDVGPFMKGLKFGYGHAEKPVVKVGDVVQAGQHIGTAGFANAWHIHLVCNDNSGNRGVGDRDPMPFVNYAIKNG